MAVLSVSLLTPDDYKTTRWSGGSTTQLLISPPGADYADRDFLWRISSAVVEDGTSTFTPLPDYERFIATLEGSIVLQHNGGSPLRLEPFQVHRFDGGSVTESVGRCRDFNLMLRKGQAQGTLQAVLPAPGEMAELVLSDAFEEALLYCAEGACSVSIGGRTVRGHIALSASEALLITGLGNSLRITASENGTSLMLAQMRREAAEM